MATTPAASPAAEEGRGRLRTAIRRFRPPNSVVFTLVGALFTLWVLPAFGRQWEDRQKARELQASLIEDIAVASSEAEATAEAATNRKDVEAASNEWQVEQNKVDARLRAYFGASIVDDWKRYADAQGSVLAMALIDSDNAHPWVVNPLGTVEKAVMQAHIDTLLKAPGDHYWSRQYLDEFAGPDPALRGLALTYAQDDLANSRSIITASILSDSPRGYSTSRRDLWSDLIP